MTRLINIDNGGTLTDVCVVDAFLHATMYHALSELEPGNG